MLCCKSGEILCAVEQIPCKICSLRLILMYHFASVARKQDTVNVRWLSQYVECCKPVNPLGTGIWLVLCLKATKHKEETETCRWIWLRGALHTHLPPFVYSIPPQQYKLQMASKICSAYEAVHSNRNPSSLSVMDVKGLKLQVHMKWASSMCLE